MGYPTTSYTILRTKTVSILPAKPDTRTSGKKTEGLVVWLSGGPAFPLLSQNVYMLQILKSNLVMQTTYDLEENSKCQK